MPALKKMLIVTGCTLFILLRAPFEPASTGGTTGGPEADLGGITVHSGMLPSGAVTLKNGEYREPAAPGSASAKVVKLTDLRAFGAMNGRDAAAAVIVTDSGGSGTFFELAHLLKHQGSWINVDTIFLGDRVKVHSVAIRDNEIFTDMTTHGPGDALCCPTQEITRRFSVRADRLIAMDKQKQNSVREHDIIGPVWHWVRTRYANDTTFAREADAAGYTLQLKPDGTIKVRGDCNVGGGSFTLKDANLSITVTHTTLAACPEGSREDAFMRDLNRTGGFLIENGSLLLNLKLDAGTMEFHE